MKTQIAKLVSFRQSLYALFTKRKDAIMNLLDALTSQGYSYGSVVQLSQANCFERQYSSITDAISDGLPHANWGSIQKLVYRTVRPRNAQKMICFLIDCTNQPRPYAAKLEDRSIVHAPNPAPGNKPICVGHQFSVIAMTPEDEAAQKKHWVIPLATTRIKSDQKGNEAGMKELVDMIDQLKLQDQITLSVGDTLYGTENCRITAAQQDNLIHLFRLSSKRNVFAQPQVEFESARLRGRPKEYGAKMNLGRPETQPKCDQQTETTWTSRQGKVYTVVIKCWENRLIRGSRHYRSSEYPLNVIQVTVMDKNGKPRFKRPLWLGVFGNLRDKLSLVDAYLRYASRYDIEHYFRFGKRRLLMNVYQTATVSNEENWWQLNALAYIQLYLAKEVIPKMPLPWERYLPEYQSPEESNQLATPSQTQRGFATLLEEINTPAVPCVPRGKAPGRVFGETVPKRVDRPIKFKSKKAPPPSTESIISGLEITPDISDPQKIQRLLETVRKALNKINFSPPDFAKMLLQVT